VIEFAEADEREEWEGVGPLLKEIVTYAHDNLWPAGRRFIVSSIWRSRLENAKVGAKTLIHTVGPPYRAVDADVCGWSKAEIMEVCAAINRRWQYDPTRPNIPAAYGEKHGTGPHIHFQVHANTVLVT